MENRKRNWWQNISKFIKSLAYEEGGGYLYSKPLNSVL